MLKKQRFLAKKFTVSPTCLQVFPVAMSLVASFVSGITLLGETLFDANDLERNLLNM
jgi:hypothetical protein